MAAHSSILAWSIPGTEEPGGLQSMESQGVELDMTSTFFLFFQGPTTNPTRVPRTVSPPTHIDHKLTPCTSYIHFLNNSKMKADITQMTEFPKAECALHSFHYFL